MQRIILDDYPWEIVEETKSFLTQLLPARRRIVPLRYCTSRYCPQARPRSRRPDWLAGNCRRGMPCKASSAGRWGAMILCPPSAPAPAPAPWPPPSGAWRPHASGVLLGRRRASPAWRRSTRCASRRVTDGKLGAVLEQTRAYRRLRRRAPAHPHHGLPEPLHHGGADAGQRPVLPDAL